MRVGVIHSEFFKSFYGNLLSRRLRQILCNSSLQRNCDKGDCKGLSVILRKNTALESLDWGISTRKNTAKSILQHIKTKQNAKQERAKMKRYNPSLGNARSIR